MTPQTPTEHNNELRVKIHVLMIAFRREDGNNWIDRSIERLDEVMYLIEEHERQARIDELDGLRSQSIIWSEVTGSRKKSSRFVFLSTIDERIAQLQDNQGASNE